MSDTNPKQQIVEKIKSSTNILVTVSNDPSVDALSAALGLTLMLDTMGKHATAVFSGAIPPAISFLDPAKTFENTTDSLRDFIIALDKEKADHLRYKVDGDVVKIFITPYRTTITSSDLDFSQGDYNVELVLCLGVDNQDHLDAALEAHGKILHDATVATISAGGVVSNLGDMDWREEQASSLSEMLVSLSEALKSDKPLLDQQVATALLTGIVAATDRFSNNRTTSRVMTMAAQLMAAGADQQLIAAKLQEGHEINTLTTVPGDESLEIPKESISEKINIADDTADEPGDGGFAIVHDKNATLEDIANEVKAHNQEDAAAAANQALAEQIETTLPVVKPSMVLESESVAEPAPTPATGGAIDWTPPSQVVEPEPMPPSTYVETPVVPSAPPVEINPGQTHSYLDDSPTYPTAMNGSTESDGSTDSPIDIFANNPAVVPVEASPFDTPIPSSAPADALAEVHATFGAQPYNPPMPMNLPQPPPLPDFSAMPQPPAMPPFNAPTVTPPEILGDIFAPETPPQQPPSDDPGQFRIPGQ